MTHTVDQHEKHASLDPVDKKLATRSFCTYQKAAFSLSIPEQVSGQANPAREPNGKAVSIHTRSTTTGKKELGKKEAERIVSTKQSEHSTSMNTLN